MLFAKQLASALAAALLGACATTDASDDRGTVTDAPSWGGPPSRVLRPGVPPTQNFNLARWKLTLPSGDDVQVDELNDGFARANIFYTDARGGMVFRCPNRAGSTKDSKYSRTELREMRARNNEAKSDENNWRPEEGGTLSAKLAVDRVSVSGDEDKVGRVIIGQIHGPKAEVVRLYYEKKPDEAKGRVYAGLDSFKNKSTTSPDIVANGDGGGIALGEPFSYRIQLRGTDLTVLVQPATGGAKLYRKSVDPRYLGKNVYFKAGVYNQNDGGDRDDYAQATFYALDVSHP